MSIGIGTSSSSTAFGLGFNVPAAETSSFDKLVLTLDVLSAKTNKLIWRGSLASRLFDGSTPETNNKLVTELVTEILKNFPPQ